MNFVPLKEALLNTDSKFCLSYYQLYSKHLKDYQDEKEM